MKEYTLDCMISGIDKNNIEAVLLKLKNEHSDLIWGDYDITKQRNLNPSRWKSGDQFLWILDGWKSIYCSSCGDNETDWYKILSCPKNITAKQFLEEGNGSIWIPTTEFIPLNY